MLTKSKLLTLPAENNRRLVDLLWSSETKADAPEPAPEPPAPRKLRQSELPGVDMLRSIPRPKPPSAPGMQSRRFNGSWWHY